MSNNLLNLADLEPMPEGFESIKNDSEGNVEEDIEIMSNDMVGGIEEMPEDFNTDDNSDGADEKQSIDSKVDDVIEESTEVESEDIESEDVNVYAAFANEFITEGLIPDDVDIKDFTNAKSLVEAIKASYFNNIDSSVNQFKSNIAKDYKDFIDNEDIEESSNFLKYSESDFEDNDELSKKIMTHYYKDVKGLGDKVVQNIVENEIDYETAGKELYKALKDQDEANQAEVAEKFKAVQAKKVQEEQDYTNDLMTNAKNLGEFIPSVKMTDKRATKIVDSIPDVLAKVNSNKEEFLPKLALMMDLGFFDGKFDVLLNAGATKNTTDLERALKNSNAARGGVRRSDKNLKKGIVLDQKYRWDK